MLGILLVIIHLFHGWRSPSIGPAPIEPPSLPLPPEIRSALTANADALRPQVSANWDQVRSSNLKPSEYRKANRDVSFAQAEIALTGVQHVTLAAQGDGQFRQEWSLAATKTKTQKLTPRFHFVYAYDGEHLFEHGMNPNEDHSLTIFDNQEMAARDQGVRRINADYFSSSGYYLPVQAGEISRHESPSSIVLNLLDAGARLKSIESIERETIVRLDFQSSARCPVHRIEWLLAAPILTDRTQKLHDVIFDLDPAMHYALRHFELRDPEGRAIVAGDCNDFEACPGKPLWLPKTCALREFPDGATNAVTTTTFTLKQIDFDPIAKPHFTLEDHQPGTWIIRHEDTDRQTIEVVQRDGSLKPRQKK